eukprot:CAMPEP_0195525342 /NCGR_PEP_ID=MMETSP0794_2-20130614/25760_1 /TAXON_ID=515487 /ORGANISM="Stephanopyxis turris, Strain CCMP 815" /LENGTH=262 /DNA_ID=CAMNT_0040655789 /DNA_START=156 /DNA_END=944 /DNA_ORIENTATION=-
MKGVAFGLRAFQVPTGSRVAKGVPIPSVLPLKSDDVVASILPVSKFSADEFIVLATEHGWIKKTPLDAFETLTSRGLIIAALAEGDCLRWCKKCTDDDDILVGSSLGMATRFAASQVRPTGRTSRGVRSMKLKEGDKVTDMSIIERNSEETEFILTMTANGYGKRVQTSQFRSQARGGVGVIATKFKSSSKNDVVSCLRIVHENDEVLIITNQGIIVRQKVNDIPCQGRAATGVMVQKVDVEGGDEISSVSIVPQYDEVNEA